LARILPRLSRRQLLGLAGAAPVALSGTVAYARWVEPGGGVHIARHAPRPAAWPTGQRLTIAALADLHCGSVHMPPARIAEIIAATMALKPDLIVLLGDYICREAKNVHGVAPAQWAGMLAELSAPLGVHAILGNHEYWDDPEVRRSRQGRSFVERVLAEAGIPLLANRAIRLEASSGPFWLAGLDSQLAYWLGPSRFRGRDDLPGTLAQVVDDAPVILLAHEPDIFVNVPDRVALTLSGHTHGGQVHLLGWTPYVPSNFGDRFRHGHIIEDGRHLVVSAGLGTSGPPLRLGVPPEILLIEMGTAGADRA
jgi:predicted MPP superfamily phosphohydrolase